MSDLFPTAKQISPRLLWYTVNNLTHRPVERNSYHGNGEFEYMCSNLSQTRRAFGADETDASLAFAKKYGLSHYDLAPSDKVEEIW